MHCSRRYVPPLRTTPQHTRLRARRQSRFPTTQMREEVGRSIGLSARKVQVRRNCYPPLAGSADLRWSSSSRSGFRQVVFGPVLVARINPPRVEPTPEGPSAPRTSDHHLCAPYAPTTVRALHERAARHCQRHKPNSHDDTFRVEHRRLLPARARRHQRDVIQQRGAVFSRSPRAVRPRPSRRLFS